MLLRECSKRKKKTAIPHLLKLKTKMWSVNKPNMLRNTIHSSRKKGRARIFV